MAYLHWAHHSLGHWPELTTFDLERCQTRGVYVILHGGRMPRVVRVGQGNIDERLRDHRRDRDILRFASLGLFVTWAPVGFLTNIDGIERYLAERFTPLVGERFPFALPVPVNSPFEPQNALRAMKP